MGGVVCDCHITECGERPRNDARAAQSFQFQGALGQLPYFFAGVGACRFAREFRGAGCLVRLSLWVAAFLGVALIQVVWFASAEVAAVAHELYVLTVIATLFLLLEMRVHNRFFVWLGGYAYSIYLFHGFGTAGGRILLKMLGVKAVAVVFPWLQRWLRRCLWWWIGWQAGTRRREFCCWEKLPDLIVIYLRNEYVS